MSHSQQIGSLKGRGAQPQERKNCVASNAQQGVLWASGACCIQPHKPISLFQIAEQLQVRRAASTSALPLAGCTVPAGTPARECPGPHHSLINALEAYLRASCFSEAQSTQLCPGLNSLMCI